MAKATTERARWRAPCGFFSSAFLATATCSGPGPVADPGPLAEIHDNAAGWVNAGGWANAAGRVNAPGRADAGGWTNAAGRGRAETARFHRRELDDCRSLFGYHAEEWTYPDQTSRTVYVRTTPAGERVEIDQEHYESTVWPSVDAVCRELGRTSGKLRDCPGLNEMLTELFEKGVTYRGTFEGANSHPHARGTEFWSPPVKTTEREPGGELREVEDPISSVVWLLLEAFNASTAKTLESIYDRARWREITESEFLREEAIYKARNLKLAVDVVLANALCLNWEQNLRQGRGAVLHTYLEWIEEARLDVPLETQGVERYERTLENLAQRILDNPATYVANPAEHHLTYGERLRRIYRGMRAEARKPDPSAASGPLGI